VIVAKRRGIPKLDGVTLPHALTFRIAAFALTSLIACTIAIFTVNSTDSSIYTANNSS
jgi:hypothetical protein